MNSLLMSPQSLIMIVNFLTFQTRIFAALWILICFEIVAGFNVFVVIIVKLKSKIALVAVIDVFALQGKSAVKYCN